MELKDIVAKGNSARFSYYRDGNLFYTVEVGGKTYAFPVPIEDTKGGTFLAEHKAVNLMRWIRKALDDRTFQIAR